MKFFDLLIVDVDGVLTDGTKTYDVNGNVISKRFCDKDFTAIKKFKAIGIEVIFLSGDRQVNEAIAKSRNIDFYCSRDVKDKVDFLPIFESKYKISRSKMAYVGDDVFDYEIMKAVGYPYHTEDADKLVKETCKLFNEKYYRSNLGMGGSNCIQKLFDNLVYFGMSSPSIEEIKKLDLKESSTQEMS